MQYIVVFSGLVTIIVGFIAVYQFIQSIKHPITRSPWAILGVITVILIVFTIVLANNSPLGRGGDSPNPTPGTGQVNVTTTATQQIPSPTSTPTPIQPTPTPVASGQGCSYDTSTGWADWQQNLPEGWRVVNGELNGNGNGIQSIQAPDACTMTSPDYVVKSRFKAISASGFSLRIAVRANSPDDGYIAQAYFYAGEIRIFAHSPGPNDFPIADGCCVSSDKYINYMVTVKGNTITFSADGGTVTATNNTYYLTGNVYFASTNIQFSMQSFSVKPL